MLWKLKIFFIGHVFKYKYQEWPDDVTQIGSLVLANL